MEGQTSEIPSVPTENCHDKLFKSSLADFRDAAMELRAVLPPALASQIDFTSLKPEPGTFVDDAMRGSQTDLLYSVECAGKLALGLFDPALILDADLRRLTPEFEVLLDDISFASDDSLRARGMGPAATLGFLFLRDGRRGRRILDELLVWADLLQLLAATESGRRALYRLFRYLSMVAPNIEPKEFIERVHQALPERNDIVSTLAEQWMEQGEKRGIEKGYRSLVRRQIELKFGPLDSHAIAKLTSADDATLERYGERVLSAMSADEVLGE